MIRVVMVTRSLWTCWCWFGPFCWWKLLSNFLMTVSSIMVKECAVFMSKYDISRVSITYSICTWNLLESCCLFVLSSNFLYSISNVVTQCCRCFNFEISIIYLPVRFFVCTVSSFNRYVLLLPWRAIRCNYGGYPPSPRLDEIKRSCYFDPSPPSWGIMTNTAETIRSKPLSIFI